MKIIAKWNLCCSTYSNLHQFCDIYPLSKAMKEQLYRAIPLDQVSTAATVATSPAQSISSDLHSNLSNHTYEPIETASEAFSAAGDYSVAGPAIPVTLIHHDGKRVTANKIVSLESLRQSLQVNICQTSYLFG